MLLEHVGHEGLVLPVHLGEQVDAVAWVGGVEFQRVVGGNERCLLYTSCTGGFMMASGIMVLGMKLAFVPVT